MEKILVKIRKKEAKIGILGLGYVGLPLATSFGKAGFYVVGIDPDEKKVEAVQLGKSVVKDVADEEVAALVSSNLLLATSDFNVLGGLDVAIICVPTPLTLNQQPDLTYVIDASSKIAENLRPNQLVILESTTYPGTTEEVILPRLAKEGFKVGKDFFLAFSPERVDPGNKKWNISNTPKVVGGMTSACTEVAACLYQNITSVVKVSSPKAAEMTKLLENTFRNVNIAMVNELMLLCERMKIDIWEVIEAASTKPFGFMPFYPGPGVGGHCIPIDPFYLSWKAKEYDFYVDFIELAAKVNTSIPYYVVDRIHKILRASPKEKARILLLGAAFKPDIDDLRHSPSLKVLELLNEDGVEVIYNDPCIPSFSLKGEEHKSVELTEKLLLEVDLVVILTAHSQYDLDWIVKHAKKILDTRNATKNISSEREKIVKL